MTMSDNSRRFLTPDDLYQLTGYRRPSLQCKALKESGVFFIPRKDGRPGTTWSHVDNPAGMKKYQAPRRNKNQILMI
ncbi:MULTISPECIES: DUF4224 domain-containing protein [Kosakonia]|uniref:DUF4224 domain-containing protein n=1 Tax=Kosakonia TaxID=1330547 RepID=UPI002814D651|nr:DUF4224 domain-containing protein [Kosakonia sp. S42]